MSNKYKLSDEVIGRLMQLIQEAMLFGTDVVDSIRLIDLQLADDNMLRLTPEYLKIALEENKKRIEDLEKLQSSAEKTDLIVP